MLPELGILREVQDFDLQIASLDGKLAAVPGALKAIDARIADARERLTNAEDELKTAGSDRRRTEGELEDAESALAKYEEQLMGARTNDEYRALQKQIAATKSRISGIEDQILTLMETMDRLEGEVGDRKREFEATRSEFEAKKAEVRAEADRRRAEREALAGRRTEAASGLPAANLERYERIRQAREGVAVVVTPDARCPACSVRLRPQVFEEIRIGKKLIACDSCSRIIVFDPGPEDESG